MRFCFLVGMVPYTVNSFVELSLLNYSFLPYLCHIVRSYVLR